MTVAEPISLAHGAVTMAVVLGLMKPRPGLRIAVAELADAAGPDASADLIVAIDDGRVEAGHLRPQLASVRATLDDGGVFALVVGSPVTNALVATASDGAGLADATVGREDPYARAIAWAAGRRVRAPALDPQRLRELTDLAAEAGLVLVEPELAIASPALGRVRGMKTPRMRAVLATVALGASSRPLLFVPARAAPKGGLARAKVERLSEGWAEASRVDVAAPATDLVSAALAVLHAEARDARGPLRFGDLLRDARERWAADARASGARAAASSTDARELTAALHQRCAAGDLALFVLDPSDPGWALTLR